tara:strand:+ start:464 stop:949 length:486 start_codon:yes stop_codon:yes gene_type:complete
MTAFDEAWRLLKYSLREQVRDNVNAPTPDEQQKNKEAAMIDSMQTFGTAQPPAVTQQRQYPAYTPELYNALMSLQRPNDQSKAIPRVMKQMGGEQGVAMHHDLPSYMEEAMNQTAEKRKKREKANKLRQRVADHDEDAKVIQYYKDNHPQWFNEWKDGAGE